MNQLKHILNWKFMAIEATLTVCETSAQDWLALKTVRLQALLDAPTAFGVSYHNAITYTNERWKELASSESQPHFWLALDQDEPVGMIGAGVDQTGRFNLIGMWLKPEFRGSGVGEYLVNAVKARSIDLGYRRVILSVSPSNTRAARFYRKQGFVFIDEFEALSSHPHIQVQAMEWVLTPEPVVPEWRRS
jgi:ribosomal protein S18 acetylase RimI-like enzyme